MTNRPSFDTAAFWAALDAEQQARGLLWKDIAQQAHVSASTLTRLSQGKRPDVDSFAALVDWAGVSADDFLLRVRRKTRSDPLAMVSVCLRADRTLRPEAAEAIEKVVRILYRALKAIHENDEVERLKRPPCVEAAGYPVGSEDPGSPRNVGGA